MVVLLYIFSYLLGSIPSALWISKGFKKIDIREHGSKNVGSTNAARVLGKKLGLLTLILDILKSLIPTYIAKVYFGQDVALVCAFLAIFGHCYSIYIKFQGGKAVASSIGALLIISPKTLLIALIAFAISFLIFNYVSISSMTMISTNFIATIILKNSINEIIVSFLLMILIIYKHKSNIINILNNEEKKFINK